ncbi:MAG TPA: hypothetical protein VHI77_01105 [Solirubrobacterales bacterium]|nr:hypothetical protein [Solirubrobacterales bacterium]
MSEGTPPLSRRVQSVVAEYPGAVAIGAYAVLSLAALVAAYFSIFIEFAPYDDEGTLLVGVDAFAHGATLYRNVWSVYGPFYYELFGGLFALTGHAVTTDASRMIVIVIWVGTSLLFGLAAQRLTGRLLLGLTGMAAAFGVLVVLANEPMHPQGLCVLLFAALSLLAVFGLAGRARWTGAAFGAVLAALVLTKINLGAFALAAVVLAAALTVEPLERRAWIRWPVPIVFLAVPLFVLDRDLELAWVREMLVLEVLAGLAVIVAARRLRPKRNEGEGDGDVVSWLLGALAGFAAAAVAILVAIVLTGSSPGDVYDGMVRQAFRIRDVLSGQFPFPAVSAIDWAVLAVAAAALCSRRWRPQGSAPSIWPGLLRAVAGIAIWLTVTHIVLIGLNPSSASPLVVPMLLAWIVAIPPAGPRPTSGMRFLRVMLPAVAVAETLQAYPVPGSQLGIAAVSFVPVGALCLGDALTELRAWSEARGAVTADGFAPVASAAAFALAAIFTLNAIVMPGITNAIAYHDLPKLRLPGAELMHLAPPQGEQYEQLAGLLAQYRCTTFIGYPNVNSLYLWSDLEPPPPVGPNAWMYSLDAAEQQRAVDALRASPRPCAIRNEELAAPYLKGLPPPQTPLVRYVFREFRPVKSVGPFEFMLPKPGARVR